jgi:hypothetical protein
MKNRGVFTIFLAAAGIVATAAPALAQYYPYPPPPPRPYYQPQPHYRPDPYGGGYYQPYRPPVIGNLCVTSRGNCYTRPRPANSSCACEIPGFGLKRGAILSPNQGW